MDEQTCTLKVICTLKFAEFDLEIDLHDGIAALGYDDTTPVQAEAIPIILEGKDLIACAQTGTGKTAAYLIPTINRLARQDSRKTRALILAPTRELASQIDQNIDALAYFLDVSSVPVIGGKSAADFDRQKYALQHGADIIVATPGRLLIYLSLGILDFSELEVVILDEADKMLDMGFYADIIKIFAEIPSDRQTLMFSATMPKKIRKLAQEVLKDPQEVNLNLAKPAAGVTQLAFSVYEEQKIPLLRHLLETREVESMIVFSSSKASVDRIYETLKRHEYDVQAMHSDKSQEERQNTLRGFKNKQYKILVGTDVLARGIDIDSLSHVVNFAVPRDAEDYVHRVGRTARANTTGEAITFISPMDQYKFAKIEQLIESEVPKGEVPEDLGEAPLYDPSKRHQSAGRGNGGGGRSGGRNDRNDRNRGRENRGDDRPQNRDGRGEANADPDRPRKKRNRSGRNRNRPNRQPSNDNQPPQSKDE
jgi:superfamily II DNA/RNA helicase